MATTLRLYRDFYRVLYNYTSATSVYTRINPFSLSNNIYNLSNGSLFVQAPIVYQSAGTGVYYIELNMPLYNFDDIYESQWSVTYVSGTTSKILPTRFRLYEYNLNNIITLMDIGFGAEFTNNAAYEFEVISEPLEIQITS